MRKEQIKADLIQQLRDLTEHYTGFNAKVYFDEVRQAFLVSYTVSGGLEDNDSFWESLLSFETKYDSAGMADVLFSANGECFKNSMNHAVLVFETMVSQRSDFKVANESQKSYVVSFEGNATANPNEFCITSDILLAA